MSRTPLNGAGTVRRKQISQSAYRLHHTMLTRQLGTAHGPCALCDQWDDAAGVPLAFEWAFLGSDADATEWFGVSPIGPANLYAATCVACHRVADSERRARVNARRARRVSPDSDTCRCLWCGAPLTGRQTAFSSRACADAYRYALRRGRTVTQVGAGDLFPDRLSLDSPRVPACAACGKPLEQSTRGRVRKYCGGACRVRAHRAR